jgi:hypothetical protein
MPAGAARSVKRAARRSAVRVCTASKEIPSDRSTSVEIAIAAMFAITATVTLATAPNSITASALSVVATGAARLLHAAPLGFLSGGLAAFNFCDGCSMHRLYGC